jgi:hypothetical protein
MFYKAFSFYIKNLILYTSTTLKLRIIKISYLFKLLINNSLPVFSVRFLAVACSLDPFMGRRIKQVDRARELSHGETKN